VTPAWSGHDLEQEEIMRELLVQTFLTLDGVMQAPGGPEEDDSDGFAFGGWSVAYWDEDLNQAMDEVVSNPFAMVLGRHTYDIMAAFWPHASEEEGATVFNEATKYVASRSRPTLAWSNSLLIEGDAAEGLAALKAEDGPELQVHGSGNLAQTLIRHNLVDRYRLWIFPVVIGSGKRLFGEGTVPAGLELIEGRTSRSGVFMGTYRSAGEVVTGTFGSD
jgi:dihydrofolate reductase